MAVQQFNPIDFHWLVKPDQHYKPVGCWQSSFNGADYFTIRQMYQPHGSGTWLPSSNGVTVPIEHKQTMLDSLTGGNGKAKGKPKVKAA